MRHTFTAHGAVAVLSVTSVGSRTEDGRTGWFPSNYVEEIPLEQASQSLADKEIPGACLNKALLFGSKKIET
jgi:hypothetical protein